MSTASKILAEAELGTFAQDRAFESTLSDRAYDVQAPNCFDRRYVFRDGSSIRKTREGFEAIDAPAN